MKKTIAICYDFDHTLSPKDMQEFTLIPAAKMSKKEFWSKNSKNTARNSADNNLMWMYLLLNALDKNNIKITKNEFIKAGKSIKLFPGVKNWFKRINDYGKTKGIKVEHYVISSGLKEIIDGTSIAKEFKKVYGSKFMYSQNNVAIWPALSVNYTNKTQYLFRISKGILKEDDERLNESMKEEDKPIPFSNMIYIGDSSTDIPCMKLIKNNGGFSIGVFDEKKGSPKKVKKLLKNNRINYYAPANYSKNKPLDKYIRNIIDIRAKELNEK